MPRFLSLEDAVFRLGEISGSGASNTETLRAIVKVGEEATGADIVAIGVFAKGITNQAIAASVIGPWDDDLSRRFLQQTEWSPDERVLAVRLAAQPRDRLYRRSELIDESEFRRSKLFNDFQRPLQMGDQALGVFRRDDGLELLIGLSVVDRRGVMTQEMLTAAKQVAPYMARCWASAWRHEPEWMITLRPATRAVLDHLISGYDDAQIASLTGLSYHGVRAHLKRLFREAGVRSRLHLMQACRGGSPPAKAQEHVAAV
ncbi:MAG TPA: hypothetical protein VG797_03115 [Phycisphaerales bacterium]|nr:hypothetical protein [Phycisphaerales bacterium]